MLRGLLKTIVLVGVTTVASTFSVLSDEGSFASAGGRSSSGELVVVGSLGGWYDTRTIRVGDVTVYPGPLQPRMSNTIPGDLDADGRVGFTDFLVFAAAFNTTSGQPGYVAGADIDSSGAIDFADFLLFSSAFQG